MHAALTRGNDHISSRIRRWKVSRGIAPQIAPGRAIPGHDHFVGLLNPDKMPPVIFIFNPGFAQVVTRGNPV